MYARPQEIVSAFGEFFQSVYLKPDSDSLTDCRDHEQVDIGNTTDINFSPINETEVLAAIKKLKNKMTSGPDDIPSFIVKDCAGALAGPLAIFFNNCLKAKRFPALWKVAKVCPILKSGNKCQIENYRAVSLLCNFSKVFEIVIYDRIYFAVHRQLSPRQHGFIKNRSTVTNLLSFTQYISQAVDNNCQVDVVYTDFSKAFDRIDHALLIERIRGFGFADDAVLFMRSYLSRREQYVFYNGFKSIGLLWGASGL